MNFDSTVTLQSSNLDSALDAETRVLCRRLSSYKQFCCSSARARYAQHKCQRLSPYVFIDCSIRIQVTVTLHGAKTSVVLSKAGTVLIKLKAKTAAAGLSTVCTTASVAAAASAAAHLHLPLEESPLQGLSLRLLLRLPGLLVEVLLQLWLPLEVRLRVYL